MSIDLSPKEKIILERYLARSKNPSPAPAPQLPLPPNPAGSFSIDDLINHGRTFYNQEQQNGIAIGVAVALGEVLTFVGANGYVATMPELIAAKIRADKNHDFWQKWYAVHTEEDIGIDKKGRFYRANEPVLVIVNGGGILTPERIKRAYTDGLINNSARYQDSEFDVLLDGKLPNGESLKLYKFEEIKRGIPNLTHRFGVVMPYSMAQGTASDYYKKKGFMENPLVIARAGGIENLEAYYNLAKDSDEDLGNYHPFKGKDASVPQGRVLFLYYSRSGLYGVSLDNLGRFVGVAPEAHRARK